MHVVQPNLRPVLHSKLALYVDSGSDGAPEAGYAVTYDIDETATPAAGEFDEEVAGRVVIKPTTATLHNFAGIVKSVIRKINSTNYLVEIYTPVRGETVSAYVGVNTTKGATFLQATDGQWYLSINTLTANALQSSTVAVGCLTDATLTGSPANTLIRFV